MNLHYSFLYDPSTCPPHHKLWQQGLKRNANLDIPQITSAYVIKDLRLEVSHPYVKEAAASIVTVSLQCLFTARWFCVGLRLACRAVGWATIILNKDKGMSNELRFPMCGHCVKILFRTTHHTRTYITEFLGDSKHRSEQINQKDTRSIQNIVDFATFVNWRQYQLAMASSINNQTIMAVAFGPIPTNSTRDAPWPHRDVPAWFEKSLSPPRTLTKLLYRDCNTQVACWGTKARRVLHNLVWLRRPRFKKHVHYCASLATPKNESQPRIKPLLY